MTYKVFLGDGRELSDEDAPLTGDNARDVQVIVQTDPKTGPYFQSNSDYYVWRNDHWLGVDIFGLFDYLLDTGLVMFGRTITNEEYKAIYDRARVVKNTWGQRERKP